MSTDTIRVSQCTYDDYRNLAYACHGVEINPTPLINDLSKQCGAVGGFALFQGGIWTVSNFRHYGDAINGMKNSQIMTKQIMHSSGNIFKGMKVNSYYEQLLRMQREIKFNPISTQEYNLLSEANRLKYDNLKFKSKVNTKLERKIASQIQELEQAAKAGKTIDCTKLSTEMDEILIMERGNKAAIRRAKINGKIKPQGRSKWVRNTKSKIRAFQKSKGLGKAGKTGMRSAKLIKAGKAIKGNAAFAVIEGGLEIGLNVVPTFKKVGKEAGYRQLCKSTVKVAASVGGFAVGMKAGAAIGAAIGSIIPGAGTAIGGLVGSIIGGLCSVAGGLLCSWAAEKAAKAVVGKDELEIYNENKAKEQALEAMQDNDKRDELLASVEEKISDGSVRPEDYTDVKGSYDVIKAQKDEDDRQQYTNTLGNFGELTAYNSLPPIDYTAFGSNHFNNYMDIMPFGTYSNMGMNSNYGIQTPWFDQNLINPFINYSPYNIGMPNYMNMTGLGMYPFNYHGYDGLDGFYA